MKIKLQLIFGACLIVLFACGGKGKQEQGGNTSLTENKTDTTALELDSAAISKLQKVYFLNLDIQLQEGLLRGYMEPKDSSMVVAAFGFGDTIPLLEDLKNGWLAVYADLSQRKYDSSIGKAYIKKENLGSIKDLLLSEAEFMIMEEWCDSIRFANPDTIKIELITKKEFNENYKTRTPTLEDIKHGVKQEEGVLSIATGNGIINLKDKNPVKDTTLYDDQILQYSYQGFYKNLNAHVIRHDEWESRGYDLYSQATGEIIATTTAYPIFSTKEKFLADISLNAYENFTTFCVQKIDNKGKYKPFISINFKRWAPLHASSDINASYFWGKDGSVYVKTIVIEGAGTALENIESLVQYIKITFEPSNK